MLYVDISQIHKIYALNNSIFVFQNKWGFELDRTKMIRKCKESHEIDEGTMKKNLETINFNITLG